MKNKVEYRKGRGCLDKNFALRKIVEIKNKMYMTSWEKDYEGGILPYGQHQHTFKCMNNEMFRKTYVTYIQPKMECATTICPPHLRSHTELLEKKCNKNSTRIEWEKLQRKKGSPWSPHLGRKRDKEKPWLHKFLVRHNYVKTGQFLEVKREIQSRVL